MTIQRGAWGCVILLCLAACAKDDAGGGSTGAPIPMGSGMSGAGAGGAGSTGGLGGSGGGATGTGGVSGSSAMDAGGPPPVVDAGMIVEPDAGKVDSGAPPGVPGVAGECKEDADCVLVDNCCECASVAKGHAPAPCTLMTCLVSSCTVPKLAQKDVVCRAGLCVFDTLCVGPVVCAQAEPTCPDGQVPRVDGGCYGGCIPVSECASVPSCDHCNADQACVTDDMLGGSRVQCVDLPSGCGGKATCECIGDVVCPADCSTGKDNRIGCYCPFC